LRSRSPESSLRCSPPQEPTTDSLSPERRSWNMSRIRSTDTAPERIVRSVLHSLGYRFRLHKKSLPGKPDIVLAKYRAVIFVHGCFWHRHQGCKFCYTPKSRAEFWIAKFAGNVARDQKQRQALVDLGWRVLTVWECETKDQQVLAEILDTYLRKSRGQGVDGSRKP
jgi:DNA mismatch endonuclease (patch repair protein)